jgi:hypothetical protein
MLFRPREWAQDARNALTAARKELIRRHPDLAQHVMQITLVDNRGALKYMSAYPNTVFAIDRITAVYDHYWINKRTLDELVFVWAQSAIKLREGWIADMALSFRNPQWQNMAIDAVSNSMLIQQGVGTPPEGYIVLDDVDALTDTEDAYDAVRRMYERMVTQADELGKLHLNPEDLAEIQEEIERTRPRPKGAYGLYEVTISCGALSLDV